MNAMVEPLPLVPATWITGGRCRSGWPSASRMRHMRSSVRSIRLGCSANSRETMESIWLMQGAWASARRASSGRAASGFPSENATMQKCCPYRSSVLRHRQVAANLGGRRLGQQPAQIGQRGAQLMAVHHHVHHAVLLEIFGALKALRQLLANGLLDHAGSSEADERAGLGDLDVAQ